jgi:hypothetical protein
MKLLALAAVVATPSVPIQPAYYVANGGSDTNPGTISQPFATLVKAQTAMRDRSTKVTYIRAGRYPLTRPIALSAADSGETWTYYPPDGWNCAVLDGGSTSPTTGTSIFTLDGASNVNITGLTLQNFRNWGIGVHGGAAWSDWGFPSAAPPATNINIVGNMLRNEFTNWPNTGKPAANNGWIGAIYAVNHVDNLTVADNVVINTYSGGIWSWQQTDGDTQNNLRITGNVLLKTCQQITDCGAIYHQDEWQGGSGITIANNFIRDYSCIANTVAPANPAFSVGIYFDSGSAGAVISGNIIGASDFTCILAQAGGTGTPTAFFEAGPRFNKFVGNIIDLGTTGREINDIVSEFHGFGGNKRFTSTMISQNIYIGKWSGVQNSSWRNFIDATTLLAHAVSPNTKYLPADAWPTVTNNLYFNYGAGSLQTAGAVCPPASATCSVSDSAPVTTDPAFVADQCTYQLTIGGAAFTSALAFPGIPSAWGPPGYKIPCSGSSPSYL